MAPPGVNDGQGEPVQGSDSRLGNACVRLHPDRPEEDEPGKGFVRPRGETQTLVRANAQYELRAVEDPEPYQQFFTSLEKAMFLTAHAVD